MDVLGAGVDMGTRLRAHDWTATPLGSLQSWSPCLQSLVELMLASKQPMFIAWGPELTWLYNDAFVHIAGGKHPGSLGRASRDVWSEAWADLAPLFDRVLAGEAVHMTNFAVGLDRLGVVEEAYFDFSYTPVRAGTGRVQGLFGVCTETTDRVIEHRRDAAASARERERLFEMTRDLFGVASLDGFLRSINPAWSRLLNRSTESLLGRPFVEIIHPDDLPVTSAVVESLGAGRAVHQFQVRLLRADGTAVPLAWSAVPDEGGLFYTVGRDISDDLLREEILRQGQKMEAVGQLTGGIAHDFNNLLQAIYGGLDLIRRKPEDPARVLRLAESGLQAAERGRKLTAQLLAFSREQHPELRPVDVGALLQGLGGLLQNSLGPEVDVSLDLEGDLVACADPAQLETAILNLATNAREAMLDGGAMSIKASSRAVDEDPELARGRYVEVRVSDTGPGMSPAVAARAFDPFFTTKSVGKSAGLGLSQVYGMAKKAGGTARIEALGSSGTSIVILLKVADPPTRASLRTGSEGEWSGARPRAVLVIDDDLDVRHFLANALEALGYEFVLAADGKTGLSELDRQEPDVVLLDFAMPGMNGAEVADKIRKTRPHLPIIFASGYSDTAAIEAAVGTSKVLLRKPFGVDELQAVLGAVFAVTR